MNGPPTVTITCPACGADIVITYTPVETLVKPKDAATATVQMTLRPSYTHDCPYRDDYDATEQARTL